MESKLSRIAIPRLANGAASVRYAVETALVGVSEAAQRAAARLNPRLYSERLRIRKIFEGRAPSPSRKVAVFLVYSRSALPRFTTNFIAALNRRSFNVIVVSNGHLNPDAKADLLRNCCMLVERANFGRDFGGYKDGIGIALRRFPDIARLVIANDSLFFLERGLDALMAELDGPHDFIGVSEVLEHRYHAASFLLSFGPGVIADPAFRRFWSRFLPVPTRMWAILEGECALTKVLTDAGHRPHILFRADQLSARLRALSASEMRELIPLFPRTVRGRLSTVIERVAAHSNATADSFAEAVVKEVMARNQMHTAGFAFMKLMGLPLFKRDIVYRGLFSLQEARQIVAQLDEPEQVQTEIMDDLARRPPPGHSDLLRSMLHRHGHI